MVRDPDRTIRTAAVLRRALVLMWMWVWVCWVFLPLGGMLLCEV